MELRSRLGLDSSWQASAKLNCLLRIINSSGVIMDEPYASERAVVTLVQPDSSNETSEPPPLCYIGIDSAHLRGYFLSAVELISSSRTVEVYSRPAQDYIETSRGSLTEKQEDGTKLYSVQFELPSDLQSTGLSLKLLSLQGRREVCVKELNVIVTEDHGGTKLTSSEEELGQSIAPPLSHSQPGFNLQQMLQSVGASQGVPPFLKSLASSLQLLQLQQSTQPSASSATHRTNTAPHDDTSAVAHGEASAGSNIPLELSQMMDAFKQMRPPPPPPATSDATDNDPSRVANGETEGRAAGRDEEASSCHSDEGGMNECIAKLLEERLSELERRLQGYVDSKLAELEMKLAVKLDKLSSRVNILHQQSQNTDNKQCNIVKSNGIVAAMPISEDQQLD